jgi:hypothetical protein
MASGLYLDVVGPTILVYRDPSVLWNTHDDGVVSFTRCNIYIILDICISHVYMDQHDDSPSIQATQTCTTSQFEAYRKEGEGCLAQDTPIVEHFEKDYWSLPNPWIIIVS